MGMGSSWYKAAVEAVQNTDWKMVEGLSDPRYWHQKKGSQAANFTGGCETLKK